MRWTYQKANFRISFFTVLLGGWFLTTTTANNTNRKNKLKNKSGKLAKSKKEKNRKWKWNKTCEMWKIFTIRTIYRHLYTLRFALLSMVKETFSTLYVIHILRKANWKTYRPLFSMYFILVFIISWVYTRKPKTDETPKCLHNFCFLLYPQTHTLKT